MVVLLRAERTAREARRRKSEGGCPSFQSVAVLSGSVLGTRHLYNSPPAIQGTEDEYGPASISFANYIEQIIYIISLSQISMVLDDAVVLSDKVSKHHSTVVTSQSVSRSTCTIQIN